jgi:hypothetical protein
MRYSFPVQFLVQIESMFDMTFEHDEAGIEPQPRFREIVIHRDAQLSESGEIAPDRVAFIGGHVFACRDPR